VLVLEEYNKVLELDSSNTKALNSMANLHYRSAKFDEAERYYRKTIEVDASNSEALYTLAVIEWHRSYVLRMEKRAQLKFSPRQPLIDSPACHEIRKENLARVEEGISLLTRIPRFSISRTGWHTWVFFTANGPIFSATIAPPTRTISKRPNRGSSRVRGSAKPGQPKHPVVVATEPSTAAFEIRQ